MTCNMKKTSIFGAIWGFVVSLTVSYFLILIVLPYLPREIISNYSILIGAFVLGILIFNLVKDWFKNISLVVGIVSIIIFALIILYIPVVAVNVVDKIH